ncbi:MAG: hypothetical protein OEM02_12270 [Desulfobulbaceae bacterium]|nr:hypothetical protein [Desulfobulbaceae bacterium]
MYEELLMSRDDIEKTINPKLYKAFGSSVHEEVLGAIDELKKKWVIRILSLFVLI